MFLIFSTIILLIIIMFGNTILSMISTYTTSSNPNLFIGNFWFVGLIIINIIIIIFIYSFYYYKSTSKGVNGSMGDKGFTGYEGEPCMITIPNSNYYVKYSKI